MSQINTVPFPRSYWVSFPRLLAGFSPGAPQPEAAREKLRALHEAGIRTIVNLMEEIEIGHHGEPLASCEPALGTGEDACGERLSMVRHAIRDVSVPTHEGMVRILDTIDAQIERGRPVYVHCRGGRGRTGTVVGCWLARHGIAVGDAALERIRVLRARVPDRDQPSPETGAQRDMVRGWEPGL